MPEKQKIQEVNALMGENPLAGKFGIDFNEKFGEALSETQVEEVKEERKCGVCGSTEIYKYSSTQPLCAKCAGVLPITRKHPPYVRETKKVGRNELCPCGSDKKFKKCCNNGITNS